MCKEGAIKMANIANLWEKFVYKFFQYAPSIVGVLNFISSIVKGETKNIR